MLFDLKFSLLVNAALQIKLKVRLQQKMCNHTEGGGTYPV
jgi:hypothetical protein